MRALIPPFVMLLSMATAAELPRLEVSANHRLLVTAAGKPFFYLADTAWELFHRLNREETAEYLDTRQSQGFTVIQAVALAELDGIGVPNAYGNLPLTGGDLDMPNEEYWRHVDWVIDQANARGMYIALLPTWGSWVKDRPVVTTANATRYAEFLGRRYGAKGVIWVLGGDRTPTGSEDVWRVLARGLRASARQTLITFHPRGGETSSTWFHSEPWLDFNMQQDGHGPPASAQSWAKIAADYAREPVKPVLDGEPLYEDHPLAFRAKELGYSFDAHVRQYAYADVFSGACGHTYGNHAVWQFYAPGRKPVNGPLMDWRHAIVRPGASQMHYLRTLIESRSPLTRVPDASMVVSEHAAADHVSATRGDGYAFFYSAQGRKFTVRLGAIAGPRVRASWMNPRDGSLQPAGEFDNAGQREFAPPSEGFASDWVLILDSLTGG